MFTQFFGNYLINKGIITSEQLIEGLSKKSDTKVKLGALAINKGFMSLEQVEQLHELQKVEDKRIGDLAIEQGFMTSEQVIELLSSQTPDYLSLAQALLESNSINEDQFNRIIIEYRDKFEIIETEEGKIEKLARLLEIFCELYDFSGLTDELISQYFILLMNNFIRFIGDDFVFLSMTREKVSLSKNSAFIQDVKNKLNISSIITLDKDSSIGFASRFAKEDFNEFDEFVEASMYDFLNIQNGMFIVSLSNQYGIELTLTPPDKNEDLEERDAIVIKLEYPFGKVDFIISK